MVDNQIIVIGAGVGGLAAAIRLAHAGARVSLYESASTPGGKMRCLPSAAGPVDAGPTVLTMRSVSDALFRDVDARMQDYVTLEAEPLLARHFWPDGSRLDLFSDHDASVDAVRAFAGARAAHEFTRFSDRARALFDAFEAPMMQSVAPTPWAMAKVVLRNPRLIASMAPGRTLAAQLARDFTDPRLRQLFGRYATYVGGSPYAAPALLALIWRAEAAGVWRVQGGMHALAEGLAKLAKSKDVALRYDASVTRIATTGGRVSGIELADGSRIAADTVVFNGDPRALSHGVLGTDTLGAVPPQATEPRSLSAEVWAFAATPDGADLAHHNVFFGRDPTTEFIPIARGDVPVDPTIYVCAQDRGSGRTPPQTERFEIIVNASAGSAEQEFPPCHQRTFQTLADRGLSFTPTPGPDALTTPQGFDRLFPASAGALYGRSPDATMAAFARPTARTAVPGLYLAGGGAHPGAGVPMATLSGQHAAATILSDRTSTSPSRRTDMPGGMSTGSATMVGTPSRSSGS
ncbi:phytoene desaturase [Maribius pontilimi]|uniref:Phytoene desaturase n=1 Tax=Palleronia pontilimi TaxID=1964209 RepID=A0A934I6P5_9RHOB|nr:1-hydroxycarotenoid 3,4-desaturase CrtD [Palleronia pontilimi]MBJ3761454.1 phytoene desaturase [Palleronia pontilimi]